MRMPYLVKRNAALSTYTAEYYNGRHAPQRPRTMTWLLLLTVGDVQRIRNMRDALAF